MKWKNLSSINQLGELGEKISYKWNEDISMEIEEIDNEKIIRALDHISYKGRMAVGALIYEWIICRFEGLADITDAAIRLDAAWASAIAPCYSKYLDFEYTYEGNYFETHPMESCILKAQAVLELINLRYLNGDVCLGGPVANLIHLAKHIRKDKKSFSLWLSEIIKKTSKTFPFEMDIDEYYDDDDNDKTYDCLDEEPVYRDFFETDFVHTPENAKKAINDFLKNLDPLKNPYLCTPEEMIANGFKGTPYKY